MDEKTDCGSKPLGRGKKSGEPSASHGEPADATVVCEPPKSDPQAKPGSATPGYGKTLETLLHTTTSSDKTSHSPNRGWQATVLSDGQGAGDASSPRAPDRRSKKVDPSAMPNKLYAVSSDNATLVSGAQSQWSGPKRDNAGKASWQLDSDTDCTSSNFLAKVDQSLAGKYKGRHVINGTYLVVRTLGTGGMGIVYLAKDLVLEALEDSDPFVAIKVLNDQCRGLPGAMYALRQEAKKAQSLSHVNIVRVHDFALDRESAFIKMEYLDGKELKDYLRNSEKMPQKRALSIIECVASGLAYAHEMGLAHSDIKPANIFLATDGAVKILDFGIAKAFKDAAKEKPTLADDLTKGALTPNYASTEMLAAEPVVASDDVYALAVVAYEMLAGHHPFIGANGTAMPADEARDSGAKVGPIAGVPKRQMRAIRKGLAFTREHRYKDAGLFLEDFKPHNLRKPILALAAAVAITSVVLFAAEQSLERVVPSVTRLKPELAAVAEAVVEADGFLDSGDIDLAHRLYAQAWELSNDLTEQDIPEREKAQAILRHRMDKIAAYLIDLSRQPNIDEYRLRELSAALAFLLADDISSSHKKINRALLNIQKKLE